MTMSNQGKPIVHTAVNVRYLGPKLFCCTGVGSLRWEPTRHRQPALRALPRVALVLLAFAPSHKARVEASVAPPGPGGVPSQAAATPSPPAPLRAAAPWPSRNGPELRPSAGSKSPAPVADSAPTQALANLNNTPAAERDARRGNRLPPLESTARAAEPPPPMPTSRQTTTVVASERLVVQPASNRPASPTAAAATRSLHEVAAAGDVDALVALLDQGGAAIDDKDADGYTALARAAQAGQTAATELLLARQVHPVDYH